MFDVKKFEELYLEPTRNGLTRPSKDRGKGLKMINMGEMFAHPRINNPPMELVQVSEKEFSNFSIKSGDLIFARQSLIAEGAGKCSIVIDAPEPTVFESHLIRLRLDKSKADANYYYYFFSSEIGRGMVQGMVMEVAASGIRGSDLAKLKVLYPPIPTQRRIASILSAYDELIEVNNQRIKLLEETARELYKEWFVRMRFPDHKQAKFVKGVPEGWEVCKLGELVSSQYGYTASATQENIGPKFLRITDIADIRIVWDDVPNCAIPDKDKKKYLLKNGDIVVARTGATVGFAKRLNKLHPPTVFASYLVRLKPKNLIHSYYLGIIAESDGYKEYIQTVASGAAQPQANAGLMTGFLLFNPTDSLLAKFNSIVEPMFDQKEILEIQNTHLCQIRDRLLPRLISGRLNCDFFDSSD